MLFKVLTEDVSNGYIENDILHTLQTMSKMAQDAVIAQSESWPTVEEIRSTGGSCFHWTEAEAVANTEDIDKLIFAYTSNYAVNSRLDNQLVSALRTMDIWIHIMSELGFRDSSNPFPAYVLAYKTFNLETVRSQLIILNNLYSESSINPQDLKSTTSILYNKTLWNLSNNEAESLLQNYFYIKGHHSAFNAEAVASDRLNAIRDRAIAHPNDMENYIIFEEDSITSASQCTSIRPSYIVDDFVKKFFTKETTATSTKKNTEEDNSKSRLENNKKEIINKLFSEGNFKYSDKQAIAEYIQELYDSGVIR